MTHSAKMIEHSDGALVEISVLDGMVSDYHNGEAIDLDDLLALNKKAMDHLRNLRTLIHACDYFAS